MERVICLVMGYVFGLFQTGYLYGRLQGIDIRQHGSGNSGSTNALRVMGKKAGLMVFTGDILKTVIPCFLVRILFQDQPGQIYLYILYAGFGVILGHNFPFYLNFKGGKGIAATAGVIVSLDWRMAALCLAAFILIVAVTRYVSLGSLVVSVLFLIWNGFMAFQGAYGLTEPAVQREYTVVAAMIAAMAFWRHRTNILRLIQGKENKVGAKKAGAKKTDA